MDTLEKSVEAFIEKNIGATEEPGPLQKICSWKERIHFWNSPVLQK